MDQWTKRLADSDIWTIIGETGPALDSAVELDGLEPSALEGLERLRSVLAFVGRRLAAADGHLIQAGPVESLTKSFREMLAAIHEFVSTGEPKHIDKANVNAEAILGYAAQMNIPASLEELQGQRQAVERFRETMIRGVRESASQVDALRQEVRGLLPKLADIVAAVDTQGQSIAQHASDFQEQFSSDQRARETEFTSTEAARKEKFAEALRADAAALEKARGLAEAALLEAVAALNTDYRAQAAAIVAEIEKQKHDVEKLVGVVGNLGVTAGYVRAANSAKQALWLWQCITVGALGGLIWVAVKAFLPGPDGEAITWPSLVGRVVAALCVGALAAFAASQAAKFLQLERRNRKLALDLEALGPFVAPLPIGMQERFRLSLGERTFGVDEESRRLDDQSRTAISDTPPTAKKGERRQTKGDRRKAPSDTPK